MNEDLLNSEEYNMLNNEIALMRFIISQCNEETLINGGQVGKTEEMTFHYQLPSGLHVYSDRPFSFENIYKKTISINEPGNNIYITSTPLEELEDNKESGHYNSSTRGIIYFQNTPFISYRESPIIQLSYSIANRYFDRDAGIETTRTSILIKSDLHPDSEYPINGGLLIEGRDEYDIKQEELRGYVQGSEYLSDTFQKVIEENSKYDRLEMLTVSQRTRPLFEMLSIEKQKLQQRGAYKAQNQEGVKQNDNRMTEIQTAITGIKDLKLTQEEINYLETVLQELRKNNSKNKGDNVSRKSIQGEIDK